MVSPLVGRDRELAELDAALAAARERGGRPLLVAGEPGMGKSSLAEAAASSAEGHAMLALWGRPWESGGAPAYWPWVQLLRTLIDACGDGELAGALGSGSGWVAQLVPELGERVPNVQEPPSLDSEKARFALFDAVLSFLRAAAAERPLLVVVDDLHAADQASLLLFEFVARGLARSRILLLGAYQDAAARRRPEVARLLSELSRESRTMTLRGIAADDVARIVEHQAGAEAPAGLAAELHETTEGNPFFATEVVRLLAAEGELRPRGGGVPIPDTVRETVRRRFEPLDPETVAALRAGAVVGREFRLATIEPVLGADSLIERLDEAESAGLVAAVPGSIGRYRFAHNLFRETLYGDLGAVERMRLHGAVAEVLGERTEETTERLAELAHHFAQASPSHGDPRALDYAVRAGDQAMSVLAYEQAAELYELALGMGEALEPDPHRNAELLLALGRAQTRAEHVEARDTLVAAAAAARPLGDPRLFAEIALTIRVFPSGPGVLDEQPGELLGEALDQLDGLGDDALRARVMSRLAAALYYWPGTDERRMALAEEAVQLARRLDDPATLAHALSNAQLGTWGPEKAERDLAWMGELLDLARRAGNRELELVARNRQIDLLIELDDLRAADAALRELELTARESSDPHAPAYVSLQLARRALVDGRYGVAEELNADAAALAERLNDTLVGALARAQLFVMRWQQGRLDELEALVRRVTSLDSTPAWPAGLALMAGELGHTAQSRQDYERMAAHDFADIPRYNGWLITLAVLAELCATFDDVERARKLYDLLAPFAARNVTIPQAAYADPVERYLGLLATVLSDWDAATAHFDAAAAAARRSGAAAVELRVIAGRLRMLERRADPGDAEEAGRLRADAARRAADLGLERIAERLGTPAEPEPAPEPAPEPPSAGARSATLRREGEVWAIALGSRSVRMRDSKGLRYLALLLANPGHEIHSVELAHGDFALAAAPGGVGNGDAVLDDQAKRAYRERLEELRAELEEATEWGDPERAARAQEEIDAIADELSRAVGLGGRDRKAASNAERARVSVTKAIRSTIRRVSEHDELIGTELAATVRTGTFCSHEPDPRDPLAWHVDA